LALIAQSTTKIFKKKRRKLYSRTKILDYFINLKILTNFNEQLETSKVCNMWSLSIKRSMLALGNSNVGIFSFGNSTHGQKISGGVCERIVQTLVVASCAVESNPESVDILSSLTLSDSASKC
jgi:hypothetical protein